MNGGIMMNKETIAVHHGYDRDKQKTLAVPLYQSSAFKFDSAEHAANLFSLQELGNIYTRLGNPTIDIFEKRVAALEGGASGVATASGQAAIFYAIINVASSGDNIVISNKLYGGSVTLLTHTLKRFGIESRVFELDNPSSIENLIDEKTKAIFFESISNPQIAVADIEKITDIAKKYGVLSVCDNTVASPYLINPIKFGVDIVVHSASKYIGGHGLSIGGIIVDREGLGEFFRDSNRYSEFNEPDLSYHGLVYTSLPFPPFNLKARLSLLRDIGAILAPFNAFNFIQSLETLDIRMEKVSKSAKKVAEFLAAHPKVVSVGYPGLEKDPTHNLAKRYLNSDNYSGLLNFEMESFEEAKRVLNSTKVFTIAVNIGDSKSIITHPASTTHQQLSSEMLKKAGVKEGLIRLSIGLESVEDLIEDLKIALG